MTSARARIILGCFALVLGVVFWIGLGPSGLGGGVTYVTTTGNSMEPKLHKGDLVLLRSGPPYKIGDLVGYRDARMHRMVLHRIVAGTDAGFTTKGDNNGFRDSTHPTSADIVGRFWTSVPGAGSWIGRVRQPGAAALLVGALVLMPVRRRRRRGDGDRPSLEEPPPVRDIDARRAAVMGFGVLAIALAALGGYAYSVPANRTETVTDAYQQTGAFSYRAAARPGAAYPDGVVRTGQAVFPRLSRTVDVGFDYSLTSKTRSSVSGSGTLEAVVSDGLGWSRTLEMSPRRAFRGSATTLTGTLKLSEVRAIVNAFERETGASGTDYSLSVRPAVNVSGEVDGSLVNTSFAPSLDMRLDKSRLMLGTTPSGATAPLETTKAGTLTREAPATLSLGGLSLPVFRARAVGILGFEIALAVAVLLGLPILLEARRSEAGAIRVRMGGRLVDVAELPNSAPGGCVDLERMSDLARLADRAEMPIMVLDNGRRARYAVLVGDVLYRYATRPPVAAAYRGPSPAMA